MRRSEPRRRSYFEQEPRRKSFAQMRRKQIGSVRDDRKFNYDLDYRRLNLRNRPGFYRVGVGEQGVLLVEPYKSEILPYWRFKTPDEAMRSSRKILQLFRSYLKKGDLPGADMARKFLQMGYTRSRRYANHTSGRKYDEDGTVLPFVNDSQKAESARIFSMAWKRAEAEPKYLRLKKEWKSRLG